MILLLDNALWNLLDSWIASLSHDMFVQLLPLMRRTFAHFAPAERRKMGEKAKGMAGLAQPITTNDDNGFDHERAKKALHVAARLLGLKQRT
jgi:hypothetical protein